MPADAAPTGASCDPTSTRHAYKIKGTAADGTLDASLRPYVAGSRDFYQTLPNGWVFALRHQSHGWSVRLYESAHIGAAVDLTSLTPPLRGAPNPRDIFGWHFRNQDNSGPNTGDVNAPQERRAFVISPGLVGTAGVKPSIGEPFEPSPDDGLGFLQIHDYGLADLAQGQRARMNYLEFDACLYWPRSTEESAALADATSLDYGDEERELFGSCGLDYDAYELEATYAPRILGGDIDGDDSLDEIAQVKRRSDDKRSLALCRAGTWLTIVGDEGFGELRANYVDQTEAWQWFSGSADAPRHLVGYDLPQADGDYLVLERIEKEAVLLYWREGRLQAKRMYGHVEPDAP